MTLAVPLEKIESQAGTKHVHLPDVRYTTVALTSSSQGYAPDDPGEILEDRPSLCRAEILSRLQQLVSLAIKALRHLQKMCCYIRPSLPLARHLRRREKQTSLFRVSLSPVYAALLASLPSCARHTQLRAGAVEVGWLCWGGVKWDIRGFCTQFGSVSRLFDR